MPLPRRKHKQSFVLVIVLGMLVLITILVVGFLGHIASQSKSSTSYRDQTGTLLLGDEAVNIVKAQIDAATTSSQLGNTNLWASQPGAIRTMNGLGTTLTYKLYSSTNLVETATGTALGTKIANDLPTTTATAASDWSGSGLWTDLNAPVKKSDGTTYAYPIIDVVNDNTDLPAGSTTTPPYASGSFNINSGNTLGATRSATGNYPLPMPVRWLYVLKQGQVIAPDSGSTDTQVTFASQPTASKPTTANPVIGRIAFWTDDDTCRVNVNTSSFGTFWDVPHFTSPDDVLYSTAQPVNKEYQRYPGHVAMTTLSLALPELAGSPETIIGLTPRYYPGGSTEGTVSSTATSSGLGGTPKTHRLYASVNELLFDPPPTATGARTASGNLSKVQVEAAKFFLTAHSRAPELNLLGQPRIAIWPISTLTNTAVNSYQTSIDRLIAFCASTTGTNSTGAGVTNSYYFTRTPHNDNIANGGYIAGSMWGSDSSTSDVNLARNVAILNYLDYFGTLPLPGNLSAGATYDSKYTQLGARQILTEIFDYIRMINAKDPQLDPFNGNTFPPANTLAANTPYAAYQANQTWTTNGFSQGQILPTYYSTWGTYGYGRFNGIVVGATLDFVGVGKGLTNSDSAYTNTPATAVNYFPVQTNQAATTSYTGVSPIPAGTGTPYIPPAGTTAVQAVFTLTYFDPALGFGFDLPCYTVSVAGLNTLTLNGMAMNFPSSANILLNGNPIYGGRPGNLGSIKSGYDSLYLRNFNTTNSATGYPLYSSILNITNSAGLTTMKLAGGGPVTVSVYPLNTTAATSGITPIHTYTINLSAISATTNNLPVPGYSARPVFGSIRVAAQIAQAGWTNALTQDRFDAPFVSHQTDANGEMVAYPIDSFKDTVVSMVPSTPYGDYRMLAGTNIPSAAFVAHPLYGNANHLAYSLEYPGGQLGRGAVQGTIISGASYYPGTTNGSTLIVPPLNPGPMGATPMVPATVTSPTAGSTVNGATGPPPDFDNGFGSVPDGPYINKPDEGMIFGTGTGTGGVTYRPYFDNITIGLADTYTSFASPERQATSPVMFGSLPTGAPVNGSTPKPWQTLLFQPGMTGHAGLAAPKDEYLLDLFWMPQAEPYAISEPFSTAGKVNLNYQIFPFTYIDRSTAIQSVLASEKVAAIATSQANNYKQNVGDDQGVGVAVGMSTSARSALSMSEVDGTLRPFAQKFANYDFFHAPAEICDVYLTPQTLPSGESPWSSDALAQGYFYDSDFALVGDNTREKPYADIYSRITTKSNSFTVYYRVQTLKNPPTSAATTWTEGQGAILGDFRGSTTLERYIDPNDKSVPDYATAAVGTANLETHYKWRVVENTRFSP